MTLPIITAEMLKAEDACPNQVKTFHEHWPNGAKPTETTLLKAGRLGLDLGWFGDHFLPAAALAEYREVKLAALVEYCKITDPGLAEFCKARALAENEKISAVRAKYEKIRAPAWVKYEKIRAAALVTAIRRHGCVCPGKPGIFDPTDPDDLSRRCWWTLWAFVIVVLWALIVWGAISFGRWVG